MENKDGTWKKDTEDVRIREHSYIGDTGEVKRGDTRLAVKVGFWYFVSSFLVKAISFITTPFFSRMMNQEAYGEFSNYANWQAILLIIVGLELYNTMSRAYYDYIDDYDQYAVSISFGASVVTVVCYVMFLVFEKWIYIVVVIPSQFIHILFFTLLCQNYKLIFLARERTLYHYKSVAVISIIDLIIPTFIAVALVALSREDMRLSARIYGHYIPSALIGLSCGVYMLKQGHAVQLSHLKYALKLSLPLLAHYLTAYMLTSSDVFVTRSILGASTAAVVSIAGSVIHILTALFQSLSGAVTTWIMDNLKQEKTNVVRKYTLFYVALLALCAAGVIMLAPEIIWILGGKKYNDSILLIPGLIVGTLISATTSLFTIILTYDKRVIPTAAATTIVAALSVASKALILKHYGYTILPCVNIIAYSILFVVNYFLVRGSHDSAINIKGFIGILFADFIVMATSGFLYAHTAIRYTVVLTVIVGLFGLLIHKHKLILAYIKKK